VEKQSQRLYSADYIGSHSNGTTLKCVLTVFKVTYGKVSPLLLPDTDCLICTFRVHISSYTLAPQSNCE